MTSPDSNPPARGHCKENKKIGFPELGLGKGGGEDFVSVFGGLIPKIM